MAEYPSGAGRPDYGYVEPDDTVTQFQPLDHIIGRPGGTGEIVPVAPPSPPVLPSLTPAEEQHLRATAEKRVKARREFRSSLRAYLMVNTLLVAIWVASCVNSHSLEFFWPMFPLLAWGWGLLGRWRQLQEAESQEAEVQREIETLRRRQLGR